MQSNRNDIARDIEKGKQDGRYKDCLHLCIGGDVGAGFRGFVTHCKQLAFENSIAEGYVLDVGENHCPKDCHFFESRIAAQAKDLLDQIEKKKKEQAQIRRQKFDEAVGFITAPFRWFAKLPWQTQFLIIILAILLFSHKWGPVIIEMIKAIK